MPPPFFQGAAVKEGLRMICKLGEWLTLLTQLRGYKGRNVPDLREGQGGSERRHIVLAGNHRVRHQFERNHLGDVGSRPMTAFALLAVTGCAILREYMSSGRGVS